MLPGDQVRFLDLPRHSTPQHLYASSRRVISHFLDRPDIRTSLGNFQPVRLQLEWHSTQRKTVYTTQRTMLAHCWRAGCACSSTSGRTTGYVTGLETRRGP